MPSDRKSTRLNSSHMSISYAVFCLKKKTKLAKLFCTNPRVIARIENQDYVLDSTPLGKCHRFSGFVLQRKIRGLNARGERRREQPGHYGHSVSYRKLVREGWRCITITTASAQAGFCNFRWLRRWASQPLKP